MSSISYAIQYLAEHKSETCWNQLPQVMELLKMSADSLPLAGVFQDFTKDVVRF